MKKTVLCLALLSIVHGADVHYPCGEEDDGWIPYKDVKCVKLFETFLNYNEARDVCIRENSFISVPELVMINSADEQQFLTDYIHNASAPNRVWIGAQRLLESETEFYWNDGSVQRFTNWAIGRPSNVVTRTCVIMQPSELSARNSDFEWYDTICNTQYWFICEKLQTWPSNHIQRSILATRNELYHTIINPVPIGFVYVQLAGQPEPSITWPTVEWTEISSEYAGLFFRVEGGNSAEFGVTQEADSPRLIQVNGRVVTTSTVTNIAVNANNAASGIISAGATGAASHWGMSFVVSSGEVRPRNQAVRIWQRSN